MKRFMVLGALVGVGALSLAVTAAAPQGGGQAPADREVMVEKLRDNLFVLRGGGGNTAVFIGTNGVVVVDAKNPGWGQPILDEIKKLTPKPITTLINTHSHADHVSGNAEFPASVDIVTHENTRPNMEAMRTYTGSQQPPPNVFKESGGRGLPKRTFKDRLTIGSGADQVDLYYFGRGHTNGDAWVVFPALRTAHAGDMFANKSTPFLDANTGGSGVEFPATLRKAHEGIRNVDSLITGHSTVMTWADLKEFADFNQEFLDTVRAAMKAGQTVEQVAAAWKVPAKYTGYTAPNANRLTANVQVIFDELRGGGTSR
jgi:glyoxylase-like metal-dependent hydrolase (beta-lactamase superfamily II)